MCTSRRWREPAISRHLPARGTLVVLLLSGRALERENTDAALKTNVAPVALLNEEGST